MLITITSKRQATFPAKVLDALGAKPGDRLELIETPDGFLLRARRIDPARLAPLRGKLRRGQGRFDLDAFRDEPHDPALRD
jgi:AbrB family looped-hinge helix DNA binding protein